MFEKTTERGLITVTEDALHGMISQYIESQNIEDVKFVDLKRTNSGVKVMNGISKFFRGEKGKEQEVDSSEAKLIFNLEFKVTKIHPLHAKGEEVQNLITEFVESVLGLTTEQIVINISFTRFEKIQPPTEVRVQ